MFSYFLFSPTFYQIDLSYAIQQPANMGVSGVVLWGSTYDAMAKNECLILQDYIKNTLGPYCLGLTNFFGNCSQILCHGRGRCVRKDYEQRYQYYLRESNRNECLIPNEELFSSKQRDRDRESKKEKKEREEKTFLYLHQHAKRYIRRKCRFRSNCVRKYSLYSKKSRLQGMYSFMAGLFKGTSTKHENNRRKDNVLRFIQDYEKKNKRLSWESRDDAEFSLTSDILWEPTDDSPEYDFDDYVCKCYPGATGTHCENASSQI